MTSSFFCVTAQLYLRLVQLSFPQSKSFKLLNKQSNFFTFFNSAILKLPSLNFRGSVSVYIKNTGCDTVYVYERLGHVSFKDTHPTRKYS